MAQTQKPNPAEFRPWRVDIQFQGLEDHYYVIINNYGGWVLKVGHDKELAEFIVAAANSYDESNQKKDDETRPVDPLQGVRFEDEKNA